MARSPQMNCRQGGSLSASAKLSRSFPLSDLLGGTDSFFRGFAIAPRRGLRPEEARGTLLEVDFRELGAGVEDRGRVALPLQGVDLADNRGDAFQDVAGVPACSSLPVR